MNLSYRPPLTLPPVMVTPASLALVMSEPSEDQVPLTSWPLVMAQPLTVLELLQVSVVPLQVKESELDGAYWMGV